MNLLKRKKKGSRKLLGSRSYGYGRKRKHRKSGRKGGVGKAGAGKHLWTYYMAHDKDYFGRGMRGFKRPWVRRIPALNIGDIDLHLEDFLKKGLVTVEKGCYVLSREKLGEIKILGRGKVTRKYAVKGLYLTEKAKEKIINSGGIIESEGKLNA